MGTEREKPHTDSAGAMVDAVKVAERIVIYLAGKYIDPSAGSMEVQPIADIIAAAVPRDEAAQPTSALYQGIVERAGKARAELAELLQVPATWPEILAAVKQRVTESRNNSATL